MGKEIVMVGFFEETAELCKKCDYSIVGYTDVEIRTDRYDYLGTDESFIKEGNYKNTAVVIVPADPVARKKLFSMYESAGYEIEIVIAPTAMVSESAVIGTGSILADGCHVSTDASIGKCVRIGPLTNVMHDVEVGDFSIVSPSAVLLGAAKLGEGVYIGGNATILPGKTIAAGSMVGAGSVVTKNVSGGTVAGNPARILKK